MWFTTRPGAREPLFYHSPNAEQRVIDAVEATKDQVSVPGMGTAAVFGIVLPTTLGIEVPVFQAVGQKNTLFCALLLSVAGFGGFSVIPPCFGCSIG